MILNFRQGIVRAPTNVLQPTVTGIDLIIANNRPLEVTMANGSSEYFHVESEDVLGAWSLVSSPTARWLYLDLDTVTAVRTFGSTLYDMVVAGSAPSTPADDQHWFNTTDNKMYRYVSLTGTWIEVIRIFLAKYQNGVITMYQAAGTSQVNLIGSIRSGRVLYDGTGTAIRTSAGSFITTETDFNTYGGLSNTVRMESDVTLVKANQNIPAFSVVAIKSHGNGLYPTIELADYADVDTTILAICAEAVTTGSVVSIVTRGLITNPSWDWEAASVPAGSRLWVGTGAQKGTLVSVDPGVLLPATQKKPAVAKVLSPSQVLFQQSFEAAGLQGPPGPPGVGTSPATTAAQGTVRLTTAPSNPADPIAVSATDPRLSDSRTPLAHGHDAVDIATAAFGPYGLSNVQQILENLHNAKLNLTGGTLTGPLTLPGNPTTNLHAAPKQYVDTEITAKAVLKTGSTMTNYLTLHANPLMPLHAVPKQYVDAAVATVSNPSLGGVFITDVNPQTSGYVGNKVVTNGALDSFDTTTLNLEVQVAAISGPSSLVPSVDVNGTAVTNFVLINGIWEGSVNITITGSGSITATHGDGATFVTTATVTVGPIASNAVFAGAGNVYSGAGALSSLKAGVSVNLTVTFDQQVSQIEIMTGTGTENALTPQIVSVAPVAGVGLPATYTYTITGVVANNGNVAVNRSVNVRGYASGIWGQTYNTVANRNVGIYPAAINELHFVSCDNLHPTVNVSGVVYPGVQQALKGSESATVSVSILNANGISFTSATGELTITNPTTIEASKTVTRASGTYNVSTPNFNVQAVRSANNAVTTASHVINIADADPVISITLPAARLRSGGNNSTQPQDHVITVGSTQQLLNAPSLTAPMGTWQGAGFIDAGGATSWTRNLRVHDNDTKGTYSFSSLTATNLAGKVVTTITGSANYTIGGFVLRKCYFSPFTETTTLGTYVTDTSKLIADDFDGIDMTYQASLTNGVRVYTIVSGPPYVVNPTSNILYWADTVAVNNNTTGLAFIEIEETV